MRTERLDLSAPHQEYKDSHGNVMMGVTSLINRYISIPALVKWAHKLGKEGKCLEKHGGIKRRIGSIFHFLAQGFLEGFKCDTSLCHKDEVKAAEEMVDTFKKWWWKSGLDRVHTEIQLASGKLGYGGTIDCIARDKQGALVLVDFKTSTSLKPQYELQGYAYKTLYEACHPFDDDIETIKILRIGYEQDIEERTLGDLTPHREAWNAILRLHDAYTKIEDGGKGYKKWPHKRRKRKA